jgi:hypothetical protein
VSALVPDEASLRHTLERLEREAPGHRVLELRSSAPLPEDLAALVATRRSRAHLWAIAGGLAGGLAGWTLAVFTATAFPIVTGHMPIVAAPPSGIVVYEGIALGAVLATTACVLLEGGVARRRRRSETDAAVAAGAIEVTIEAPAGWDDAALRRALDAGCSTPGRASAVLGAKGM